MKREIEVLGFYNGHQLLDGQGEKIDFLKIIELAGRTCYKSFDKITNDSAKQFVHKLLRVFKHESVIEHSWLTLNVRYIHNDIKMILDILLLNNLFKISKRENKQWLISGNLRMFRDLFKKISKLNDNDDQKYPILIPLIREYPDFFSDLEINENFFNKNQEIFNEAANIIVLNSDIKYTLEEKLKHWWLAIRFKGGSRAFTHQLVRHRLCAISQESQRYCDEAGFYNNEYYVIPDSLKELSNVKLMDLIGDGNMENNLTLGEWYKSNMLLIDNWYRNLQNFLKLAKEKGLIKMGKVNEDARFLLPNAVCSEIVVSANLEEWRHIFKMRCDSHAQWEIRDFAMMVLKKAKSLFPGVFNDFVEEK
ncbi:MAG: FAD-dependent thymidylate synthase [Candidatus Niyogibacteria bacterium]|nr:FAD-dependent thymidylate synthase [Candidatus Niyogibacteria bacterium]